MNLFYFAPHLDKRFPDGAGFRASEIWNTLFSAFKESVCFSRSSISVFKEKALHHYAHLPTSSSKAFAACVSILFFKHYIQTKHIGLLTKTFVWFFLKTSKCNFYYIHFLWSYPFLALYCRQRILIIDTHNYDPDWWDNLEASSKWPWEKYLCRLSKKRILEILQDLPKNTILVHVSQQDSVKYRLHRPDLTHLVLPNGCKLQPRSFRPDYSFPKKQQHRKSNNTEKATTQE